MKKKKVWRYYCEWCKKSGCSGYWMRKHEQRCTMNPDRKCGFCHLLDHVQPDIADLLAVLPNPTDHETSGFVNDGFAYRGYRLTLNAAITEALPRLRELTGNCPACILAALRQKGIPPIVSDFNFKEECKDAFNRVRAGAPY